MMSPASGIPYRVLICVSHPAHAPTLISYGARLIASFREASGYVLHIHREPYDECRWSDFFTRKLVESRCHHYGLEFREVSCGAKSVATVISGIVAEQQINLVVLGQNSQSRISAILSEPLSHQLLKLHANASLHLVDVSTCPTEEEPLETGHPAWLAMFPEGWKMTFEKPSIHGVQGLFFRNAFTEFDHGFFVCTSDGMNEVLEISDGVPSTPPRHLSSTPESRT